MLKSAVAARYTSYTDDEAFAGSEYTYQIRAYRYVNGKRVYSGYSNSKSIRITHSTPRMVLHPTPMVSNEGFSPYSIKCDLPASTYSAPIRIITEGKRPNYSKKFFVRVYKNAAVSKTSKTVYYRANPDAYDACDTYRGPFTAGSGSTSYTYEVIYGSLNYIHRPGDDHPDEGYDNTRNYVLEPINYQSSAGAYNPYRDIMEFFVVYKDKKYSVKYDKIDGLRFKKLT